MILYSSQSCIYDYSCIIVWLEVNKCTFTFASEVRQIQCRHTVLGCVPRAECIGQASNSGQVVRIWCISKTEVNANLLTQNSCSTEIHIYGSVIVMSNTPEHTSEAQCRMWA